jgi:hypothetical protein
MSTINDIHLGPTPLPCYADRSLGSNHKKGITSRGFYDWRLVGYIRREPRRVTKSSVLLFSFAAFSVTLVSTNLTGLCFRFSICSFSVEGRLHDSTRAFLILAVLWQGQQNHPGGWGGTIMGVGVQLFPRKGRWREVLEESSHF